MTLELGRAPGGSTVQIDREKCAICGTCTKVCTAGPLSLGDGQIEIDQNRGFGCIACGQCVAACPRECINVTGRDLTPADIVPLPPPAARAGYDQLSALLLARRSIRQFQDREVAPDVVEKILQAASTAPMGVPPSEVGVLVVAGRAKVRPFRAELLVALCGLRWMASPVALFFLRPFFGKVNCQFFREFVGPVIDGYLEGDRQGQDLFFYDAPLALYFYGTAYADPADPVITATYAMLAGEALGLGSCLLGFPGPVLQRNPKLRARYGLPAGMRPGILLVLGYPAVKYQRAVRRRFAAVRHL